MTMKRFKIITVLLLSVLFFSCNNNKTNNSNIIEAGVSKKLNDARFSNISKVVYKLHFVVSAKKSKPLVGELEMAFDIKDIKKNVILDFRKTKSAFHKLYINGKVFKKFKLQNGHIIIPGKMLKRVEIYSVWNLLPTTYHLNEMPTTFILCFIQIMLLLLFLVSINPI